MNYSTIISLLICALLAFSTATAEAQSTSKTIKLGLFEGSNVHWIAVAVQDGDVDTTAVQMQDSAKDAKWTDMQFVEGWNHWVTNSFDEYVFPLSFRISSSADQDIVVENIISGLGAATVDTGVQYSKPRVGARRSSHGRPTKAPTTTPVTTKAPATTMPSTAPVNTKAPTTSKPSTGAGKMKMMVPLYMYPGAAWDTVAASASAVTTVAIINPNSGPGNGPDSSYKTYMNKLEAAGVEMIGYVHTSYGTRSITDVKADIAQYASEFPQVVGIFIDEAANTAAEVAYYTQVHQYIMSMPGYKYNVLNPGTVPVQAYYAISTQIVSFEDTVSKFAGSANPAFANAANLDHFSVISYGATQAQMQTAVVTAKSKGYYGWVYFTNMSGASTYNTLPSYYAAMVSYVASQNN